MPWARCRNRPPLERAQRESSGNAFVRHGGAVTPEDSDTASAGEARARASADPISKAAAKKASTTSGQKPPSKIPSKTIRLAGAAALLLIGSFAVIKFVTGNKPKPPEPVPHTAATVVPVEVRTTPAGAVVVVDGRNSGKSPVTVNLAPGNHEAVITLDGYQPKRVPLKVAAGAAPLDVPLDPVPPSLRVSIAAGKVTVDNEDVPVQQGLAAKDLAPGEHSIDVTTEAGGRVRFKVQVEAGKPPVVTGDVSAQDIPATVLVTHGDRAQLFWPKRAAAGSAAPKEIPRGGLELTNLPPGNPELNVEDSTGPRVVPVLLGAAPVLQVIIADLNAGTLAISCNVIAATVLVDEKAMGVTSSSGRWTRSVSATAHKIRLVKEGYSGGSEQSVRAGKGERKQLKFDLKPLARFATLKISGATLDAEVLVDGNVIGNTGATGALTFPQIPAGPHRSIRKDQFEPKTFDHDFPAQALESQEYAISSDRARLMPLIAVQIARGTPDIQVFVQAKGEAQMHAVTGELVRLKEGEYTFTGRGASGELSKPVTVRAGLNNRVELKFEAKSRPNEAACRTARRGRA